MAKPVNIDGLTRYAKEYDNVLRTLPFFTLVEKTKYLRINILHVQGEHKLINKRRKAGIIKPYYPGISEDAQKELMKFFETTLKPEMIYADITDNINNYRDKKVISNMGELVDNKTKKHPLESLILRDAVTSFVEDVANNLFSSERDEAVPSSATAFNGFDTKIDMLIAAGEISAANKNLITTGAFNMPTSDSDTQAYDQLVDFIRSANPFLRQGEVLLYTGEKPLDAALAAYSNKVRMHKDPTMEDMINKLRTDAKCPKLQVLCDPILGTGDNLKLMAPGLLDIGVNSDSDSQFVQVRNPFRDPNEVQFWMQAAYDTRIVDIHPKVFQINEQKNTILDLAGDYK